MSAASTSIICGRYSPDPTRASGPEVEPEDGAPLDAIPTFYRLAREVRPLRSARSALSRVTTSCWADPSKVREVKPVVVLQSVAQQAVPADVTQPDEADRDGEWAGHAPAEEDRDAGRQVRVGEVVRGGADPEAAQIPDHREVRDQQQRGVQPPMLMQVRKEDHRSNGQDKAVEAQEPSRLPGHEHRPSWLTLLALPYHGYRSGTNPRADPRRVVRSPRSARRRGSVHARAGRSSSDQGLEPLQARARQGRDRGRPAGARPRGARRGPRGSRSVALSGGARVPDVGARQPTPLRNLHATPAATPSVARGSRTRRHRDDYRPDRTGSRARPSGVGSGARARGPRTLRTVPRERRPRHHVASRDRHDPLRSGLPRPGAAEQTGEGTPTEADASCR